MGDHQSARDRGVTGQRDWLAHKVTGHQYPDAPFVIIVGGQPHIVCLNCWCAFYGCSRSSYFRVQRLLRANEYDFDKADRRSGKVRSVPYLEAVEWVFDYATSFGDYMPDDAVIQFPVCSVEELWTHYRTDFPIGTTIVTKGTLGELMRQEYSNITYRHHKNFTQCSFCLQCDSHVQNTKLPTHLREAWVEKKALHRQWIKVEKRKYYTHRRKARTNPEKYLSIIMDGMDQAKTTLPSVARESKKTERLARLKTCLTGVLVHGHAPFSLVYVTPDRYPKDANYNCAVLLDVLNRIESPLPDTLYLQLDGAGDNKNKTVLAMLGMLIALRVFNKIKLSFLPVGHTHEDIDQMFSRFAEHLRGELCPTVDKLADLLAGAFTPTPVVIVNPLPVADFRAWIRPVMLTQWKNITNFRCFKLQLNDDGQAVVSARPWMQPGGPVGAAVVQPVVPAEERTPGRALVVQGPATIRRAAAPVAGEWQPAFGQRVFAVDRGREDSIMIHTVPTRVIACKEILESVAEFVNLDILTPEHHSSWKGYIQQFQEEDARNCAMCVTFRQQLASTTVNKHLERAEFNRRRRTANHVEKEMNTHLADISFASVHRMMAIPFPAESVGAAPALHNDGVLAGPAVRGIHDAHDPSRPFRIGTARSFMQHRPAPNKYAERVGTFVAILTPGDVMPWTLAEIVGIPVEEKEYPEIKVHWYGCTPSGMKKDALEQSRFRPLWGTPKKYVVTKKPGGRAALCSKEYMDSVPVWGVQFAKAGGPLPPTSVV